MSFRSALLASAAILVAGSAVAADLPSRVAPAPYIAAAPIFTWTGFYVGLNAGAAFNSNRGISTTGFGAAPVIYGPSNGDDTSFTGGAQVGYNAQFGSFVAGVEADINYLDRKGGGIGIAPAGAAAPYFITSRSNGDNYFGTVRGRLGYAFDRALIYVTGGLAYGAKSGGSSVTAFTAGGPAGGTILVGTGGDGNDIGYALGGGLEYAFTNNWSAKLEYMHVDLGRSNRTYTSVAPAAPGFINVRSDNKFDVVRAGINYRF